MFPTITIFGYLLVAYGRKQYGDDIWEKVTDDAARFKPLIYPFQGAVKKHTGLSFNSFVNQALDYYQAQWKTEVTEEPRWITKTEKNNVVNYRFPYLAEDGSYITLQDSYTQIPAFTKYILMGVQKESGFVIFPLTPTLHIVTIPLFIPVTNLIPAGVM